MPNFFIMTPPTTTTLGGVKSKAAEANKFLTQVGTDGAVANAQPAAADLSNGVTGSGAVVLATSPALVTPALGTPSAAVLTNATGLIAGLGITQQEITINSSTPTAMGVNCRNAIWFVSDVDNSGTAIVINDNTGLLAIVGQTGLTGFTLAAPGAIQVQLTNGGGATNVLLALGGSSRNGTKLRFQQFIVVP